METAIETTKKGNLVTIPLSETFQSSIVAYANKRGISPEDAILELAEIAIKSGDLMQGKVVDISPAALEAIKNAQIDAIKKYDQEKQEQEAQEVKEIVLKPGEKENEVLFVIATPEIKEVVTEINKTRSLKGLAPLQNSLAELLFHWAKNLSDHSVFEPTTGLNYTTFSKGIKELAMAERESNAVQSNVIELSGFFGNYRIVETPKEEAAV